MDAGAPLGLDLWLPKPKHGFSLNRVSTSRLRAQASGAGLNAAAATRAELLESAHEGFLQTAELEWSCKTLRGQAPIRQNGFLVSHFKHLYLFGGCSAAQLSDPDVEGKGLVMRCGADTNSWESVPCRGEQLTGFPLGHSGVVMHHHLYVIGNKRVPCIEKPLTPVLYKYHFWSQSWGVVELPDTPAATYGTLLAADAKHIFMFGGKGAGTKVDPAAALWSYDIRDETWAICTVSGELPAPELASAFTVIGGHAYLLVMDEIHDTGLTVYQLDLVLWTWHRLPPSDTPFFMDGSIGQDTIVTAVVESRWVIHGGGVVYGNDEGQEVYNQVQVFDFKTLTWSSPVIGGADLLYRKCHMATCHNNAMIVLGGMRDDFSSASEVDCIRVKPVSCDDDEYDTVLMSCPKAPAPFHQHFTDTTVVVEGQAFQVHKAVLANSSPVFERMFSSAMLEGATSRVVITDMSLDTMEMLIGWMYGTSDVELSLAMAIKLFVASDKYCIINLHEACIRILQLRVAFLPMKRMKEEILELQDYARAIGCREVDLACHQHLRHCGQDLEWTTTYTAAHAHQAPGTLPSKHQTRSEEPGRAGSCAEADVADSVEGEVQHVDFSCSELDPEEADWIEGLQECAPHEGVSQGTEDGPESVSQGTEDGPDSVSQGVEDPPEDVSQGMEDGPDLALQSSHLLQECQTAAAQLAAAVEEALVEMSEAVAQHGSMVGGSAGQGPASAADANTGVVLYSLSQTASADACPGSQMPTTGERSSIQTSVQADTAAAGASGQSYAGAHPPPDSSGICAPERPDTAAARPSVQSSLQGDSPAVSSSTNMSAEADPAAARASLCSSTSSDTAAHSLSTHMTAYADSAAALSLQGINAEANSASARASSLTSAGATSAADTQPYSSSSSIYTAAEADLPAASSNIHMSGEADPAASKASMWAQAGAASEAESSSNHTSVPAASSNSHISGEADPAAARPSIQKSAQVDSPTAVLRAQLSAEVDSTAASSGMGTHAAADTAAAGPSTQTPADSTAATVTEDGNIVGDSGSPTGVTNTVQEWKQAATVRSGGTAGAATPGDSHAVIAQTATESEQAATSLERASKPAVGSIRLESQLSSVQAAASTDSDIRSRSPRGHITGNQNTAVQAEASSQSRHERNLLCGRSGAEPSSNTSAGSERSSNDGHKGKGWFGRSVGPVGRLGKGCGIAGAVLIIGYLVTNKAR